MVIYIIQRYLASERSKAAKVQVAFWTGLLSFFLWPLSVWLFRDQPMIFHWVLGISFLTQITTSWDFLTTSMVHKENGSGGDDGHSDDR